MNPNSVSFANHWPVSSAKGRAWQSVDGVLYHGNKPVEEIISPYLNPVFVYSKEVIREQVEQIRSILPDRCELQYAAKANPFPALLGYLNSLVDGADVASAGELEIALKAGFHPDKIGFAGPGKTEAQIRFAVQSNVTVTAESFRQIECVARYARDYRKIAIRINPNYELRASGMRMAGGSSAFGIDEEELPQAILLAQSLGLKIVGFHIYAGSQNLNGELIASALRNASALCIRLAVENLDTSGRSLEWINVGGGFGVPYFSGEKPLDLKPIGLALQEMSPKVANLGAKIRIELGRYLVAESGVYLSQVIDKKKSRGRNFLVLDGGLHHHQAACGNFGQIIKRPFPIAASRSLMRAATHVSPENSDIVGPLCTPMDTMARDLNLTDVEPGDFLAIFRSGAYGPSASPTDFLGHGPATELLI
jgi:diaminopimelate decarboxylase